MSSETKHTPGPWFSWRNSSNEMYTISTAETEIENDDEFEETGEDLTVAGVWLGEEEDAEDVAKANARLIAAAPELLAALKTLIEPCACYGRNQGNHGVSCEIARAAIAKAVGTVTPQEGDVQ